MKAVKLQFLRKYYKEKCQFSEEVHENDFSAANFTDECWATLDETYTWVTSCVLHRNSQTIRPGTEWVE